MTADRTNCQPTTGDDTKLLLHNVNFYKRLSAKADKKPKGNGIKERAVRWGCVYAVVFLFFCRGGAVGCRSYFCLIKNTLAKAVSIQLVVKDVKKAAVIAGHLLYSV